MDNYSAWANGSATPSGERSPRPRTALVTVLAAIAAVLAALLVPTAAQAAPARAAAGSPPCTVRATLPARIVVDDDFPAVTVGLTGCAGTLESASAHLMGPSGDLDMLSWDTDRSTATMFYAGQIKPGVHALREGGGYTTDFAEIGWKYTSTTIKFGTRTSAAAHRGTAGTTVSVAARRYVVGAGYVGYPNRIVSVQFAATSAGPWRTVATVRVGAAGTGSVTVPWRGAVVRAVLADTPSFFGATSPVSAIR